jgi:hypothetical protein
MSIPNPYAGAGVVIPTTTTTTCIPNYVSITLQQGNSLILPPGATIVSVSDITKIQSDCADLNNIEELECYIISINAADDGGSTSPAWSNDTTTLDGIYVGGIFYDFGVGQGAWIGDGGDVFTGSIATWINTHPVLSSLLTCTGSASQQDSPGTRGGVGTLCFKTIPSLASTIYIKVDTGVPSNGSSYGYFPARPIADYTNEAKCNCGC